MKIPLNSSWSRMEFLFLAYTKLMIINGLQWIPQRNQRMELPHVMGAIRPGQLRERLKSDVELHKADLKKNFKGVVEHAIKLAHALKMIDVGPMGTRVKSQQNDNYRSDTKYFENNDTKTNT